jgi:hypothetical protein
MYQIRCQDDRGRRSRATRSLTLALSVLPQATQVPRLDA